VFVSIFGALITKSYVDGKNFEKNDGSTKFKRIDFEILCVIGKFDQEWKGGQTVR
jgi:hypothetical protein